MRQVTKVSIKRKSNLVFELEISSEQFILRGGVGGGGGGL